MSKKFRLTYLGCILGISTQAVVTNLTAILFVPLMRQYGLELWQFGVLIGVNFASQLIADIIITLLIDKIPYRSAVIAALVISASGLIMFGLVLMLLDSSLIFIGLLAVTVLFSFGSGMQEVILTPITAAIPGQKNRGFIMSLMHSFYAWGQVLLIVITTLFFVVCGYENLCIIVFFWAIFPLAALVIFCFCPIEREVTDKAERKKAIFSPLMLIMLAAIFLGGGSETMANQYISTFSTLTLGFPKYVSDLVGMGMFAVLAGLSRVIFGRLSGRIDMKKILLVSAVCTTALFLIAGFSPSPAIAMIAVMLCGAATSLLWPGVLTVAGNRFSAGGGIIFALLSISGDIGAGAIPAISGFIADNSSLELAFAAMAVVPALCVLCHLAIIKCCKNDDRKKHGVINNIK